MKGPLAQKDSTIAEVSDPNESIFWDANRALKLLIYNINGLAHFLRIQCIYKLHLEIIYEILLYDQFY